MAVSFAHENSIDSTRESLTSPLSLRRNFIWTFFGNITYSGSQFSLLVILEKLGGTRSLGQFDIAMAVSVPIVVLCQLQLRALQVTDHNDDYLFGHYFALRLTMMVLAVTISGFVGCIAYAPYVILLIVLVAVSQAITACRESFQGVMQKQERMDYVSTGQVLAGLANMAGFAAAMYVTGAVHLAILSSAILRLLVLAFYDAPRASRLLNQYAPPPEAASLRPAWQGAPLLRLTRLALPLGIVMAVITLEASIPRYFIEAQHGETMLGYFAAIALFLRVGMLIVGALGQSAAPRLARYYRESPSAYRGLIVKLMGVAVAVGLAGMATAWLVGRPVLTLFFSADYAEYHHVLMIVMIAGAVSYVSSFLGFALTAARYLKIQMYINILAVAATLLTAWVLIPHYGLVGGAWTLVLAAGVRVLPMSAAVVYVVAKRFRFGTATEMHDDAVASTIAASATPVHETDYQGP